MNFNIDRYMVSYSGGLVKIFPCRTRTSTQNIFSLFLFKLVHGSPPFEAQRQDVTQTKIKAVEFSYPESFPQEPRPIINGLLKRDASSRMDMIDVIQSDWLKPFKLP